MIIQNCRVVTSECNDVVLESIFLPRDGKIMLNLNQHAIFFRTVHMCVRVIVHNCRVVHNTAQNSSDYFTS